MTNIETKDAEVVEESKDVPMVKRTTVKEDGRYLFYYTFHDTQSAANAGDSEDDNV